jgi:hypothetical protein
MINAAAIPTSAPPLPDLDDPAATTFDGDGESVGDVEGLMVFDARGDGFGEDVGVGDVDPVGLAVAVGFGVGFTSLSLIVTRTSGSTMKYGFIAHPAGLLRCNRNVCEGSARRSSMVESVNCFCSAPEAAKATV